MPVRPDREYRTMNMAAMPDGDEKESRTVTGYAATFGEPYLLFKGDGYEYYEVIDRGAFDETDTSDVIMQYDHRGRVFARTRNNTLAVNVDDRGLKINADLGGTEIGRELYEEIRGGYTDKMSFGFNVKQESEEVEKSADGFMTYTRHILAVGKLYDVSAVSMPANEGTSIEADAVSRSICDLENGLIRRVEAEQAQELKRERLKLKARTMR